MLKGVPKGAALLGFAGLIPFWAPLIAAWIGFEAYPLGFLVAMQLAYGAVITSFMGAVHWGVALMWLGREGDRHPDVNDAVRKMAYSVIPALWAWVALMLSPGYAQILLIISLAGLYIFDRMETSKGLLPEWYLRLRLPLTIGACGALALMVARLMAG